MILNEFLFSYNTIILDLKVDLFEDNTDYIFLIVISIQYAWHFAEISIFIPKIKN